MVEACVRAYVVRQAGALMPVLVRHNVDHEILQLLIACGGRAESLLVLLDIGEKNKGVALRSIGPDSVLSTWRMGEGRAVRTGGRTVMYSVVYVEDDPGVALRVMVVLRVRREDVWVGIWVGPIRGIGSSNRIGEIAVGVMILKRDARVAEEGVRNRVLRVEAKVAGNEHRVSSEL
jgi:hypothetical protein